MAPRSELQVVLRELLGSDNVYFQPPESIKMNYPCIVYNRDDIQIEHADNNPYAHIIRYQITVIDRDPDSDIHMRVAHLPTANYDRSYRTDNLNHDVYNLFF